MAFSKLGKEFEAIADLLDTSPDDVQNDNLDIFKIQVQSTQMNPWFTRENISFAFRTWSSLLSKEKISEWLKAYHLPELPANTIKRIALVNAGNIPLVGFHDFLAVLLSGHRYIAKNASDDPFLLPLVASRLIAIEPSFKDFITFTDRLSEFDAVIATGSNNSSRYFNYYFSKYPHIIRKNRNGVAILDGTEETGSLKLLGDDIFRYFGLGCRNVSKIYVPEGQEFNTFFEAMYDRSAVMQHNKYMNNFEHHNAVYLLKRIPFLQNGFLILKEDTSIVSAVAVLHYEYYSSQESLKRKLLENRENIQCIVTKVNWIADTPELRPLLVDIGNSQLPGLNDYADGVDTMEFLLNLKEKKDSFHRGI